MILVCLKPFQIHYINYVALGLRQACLRSVSSAPPSDAERLRFSRQYSGRQNQPIEILNLRKNSIFYGARKSFKIDILPRGPESPCIIWRC